MIPNPAATSTPTTSTPAPQAAASGPQPAPTPPAAPQPTPVQLLWEVATLAFDLMRRLVHVLRPIQQYYPKPALLLARLLIDIPRIFLTLRYAPERVTIAQLRHLTRARHILQALFNYTLPLGARTSSSATATANQSPSAFANNATPLGPRTSSSATTPSPATPASPSLNPSPSTPATPSIRQVPEIPMVAGVSHVPASPTVNNCQFPADPSPASHDSHTSHTSQSPHSTFPNPQSAIHNPQSPFSPYVPDFHTLAQALKADSLPANCAGALFENPGDALVRALHQLHAIYFSLYPNQSPSPSQSPSNPSEKAQWAFETAIHNPQSGIPQSDALSVHSVNTVNTVNPVHSPSPAQSEIPNPQSAICNQQSDIPHSEIRIPHSSAPP